MIRVELNDIISPRRHETHYLNWRGNEENSNERKEGKKKDSYCRITAAEKHEKK
jgi:hypothetical protein